jgi:arylsulfatase A-like enzyme
LKPSSLTGGIVGVDWWTMTAKEFSRALVNGNGPSLRWLAMIVTLIAGTAVCAALRGAEPGTRRPNILFALADDWGWPHAGAYGDRVVKTPTFDRIAREGVLFTSAYVSSPSCTPSRNAILTGQQFYRLGEGANLWSTLDVGEPNFMRLLRVNGYNIGHWRKAWGPGDYAAGGYQEHPCGPESTFEEFLKHRDRSKPFCFWFGTSDPHRPYDTARSPANGIDVEAIRVPGFLPTNDVVRNDIADYYNEVQRWDRDVGAALALLEQAGELDNTIIVMTGDNGMPMPRAKGNLYDAGVREPLAIRWGKPVGAGRRVDAFVSFTDFAPTFLAAAKVPIPPEMTGRSLLPILNADAGDGGPEFIIFGRERHTTAQQMPSMDGYPSRAIRTDRWLLILNLEPERWPAGVPSGATHPMDVHPDCDEGPTKQFLVQHRDDADVRRYYDLSFARRPAVELYDCPADPDQLVNLAADPQHAETVDTLRRQLTDYLVATGDPRFSNAMATFDEAPYRASYLNEYLRKHGYGARSE